MKTVYLAVPIILAIVALCITGVTWTRLIVSGVIVLLAVIVAPTEQ